MADGSDSGSFFGIPILSIYSKIVRRDAPLPSWSDADVDSFIASHPIHGSAITASREAVKYGLAGSALGAVSLLACSWKYSRSPHGALLSMGVGGVCGWAFGREVAKHVMQLYKLDTKAANIKFIEWWECKVQNEGGSK